MLFSDVIKCASPVVSVAMSSVLSTVICTIHIYRWFSAHRSSLWPVPPLCMPETHRRGPVVLRRVVVGALSAMRAWRVVLRPTHCAGSAGLEAFRTLLTI